MSKTETNLKKLQSCHFFFNFVEDESLLSLEVRSTQEKEGPS